MASAVSHFRALALSPFAQAIRRPVNDQRRQRHPLVMTLLVRDEADIVRKNIEFHLKHGVDHIIATDNGSVDGTVEILEEYGKSGCLHLIHEPDQDFRQAHWVNRMGDLAVSRFGARLLFHCDADEFWRPESGNLKDELLTHPLLDVLQVPLVNVLLRDRGGAERFPGDACYAVVNPPPSADVREDSRNTSFYLYPYPPKVIMRVRGSAPRVKAGNHRVEHERRYTMCPSRAIRIYHYPVQGKAHFTAKVVNGGGALDSNTSATRETGWHWRRWYDAYRQHRLDEEYRLLLLTEQKAHELKGAGVIEEEVAMRTLLEHL
jgi:hypothetical protein